MKNFLRAKHFSLGTFVTLIELLYYWNCFSNKVIGCENHKRDKGWEQLEKAFKHKQLHSKKQNYWYEPIIDCVFDGNM